MPCQQSSKPLLFPADGAIDAIIPLQCNFVALHHHHAFPLLIGIIVIMMLLLGGVSAQQQQINLGSFNLQKAPGGLLQLALGQGANILGFGTDRRFGLNLGADRFAANADDGLLLGGQRFGVGSRLGLQPGQGLNLGSFLNLFQPVNELLSSRLQPPPLSPNPNPSSGSNVLLPSPPPVHPIRPLFPTLMPPALRETNVPSPSSSQWPNGAAERFPPSRGKGWDSEEEENAEKEQEETIVSAKKKKNKAEATEAVTIGGLDSFEEGEDAGGQPPPAAPASIDALRRPSVPQPWSKNAAAGGVDRPTTMGRGSRGRVTTEGQFRQRGDGMALPWNREAEKEQAGEEEGKNDGETDQTRRTGGGGGGGGTRRAGLPVPNGLEPINGNRSSSNSI